MTTKPKAIGLNHVALEVGDIEKALAFYGSFLAFDLRSQSQNAAFIDLGDQFIALSAPREGSRDNHRHFGLVVEDKEQVATLVKETGAEILEGTTFDFLDPWGNRIQLVDYRDIQFLKHPEVLAALGLSHLKKTSETIETLKEKRLLKNEEC